MSYKRKITSYTTDIGTATEFTTIEVRVHYSYELDEYRCRIFIDCKGQPDSDYFTQDKEDALETACVMLTIQAKKEKEKQENT